jgi:hypothetical protein
MTARRSAVRSGQEGRSEAWKGIGGGREAFDVAGIDRLVTLTEGAERPVDRPVEPEKDRR